MRLSSFMNHIPKHPNLFYFFDDFKSKYGKIQEKKVFSKFLVLLNFLSE